MDSIKRIFRYLYYRFIRLRASQESVARGMALGLFISTTPTFGFQTAIALVLAALFRCSKIVAVIAAQLTNAITAPPIYLGTYYLGAVITGTEFDKSLLDDLTMENIMAMGESVFVALWVGGVIVGIVLAVIGYFFVIGIDTRAHRQLVRAKLRAKLVVERMKRKNGPTVEKID